MILFEEAYEKMMDCAVNLGAETTTIESSLNRVLAEDIISDTDMPPFHKSAMDGYACKRSDLDKTMKLTEVIPAGKMPKKKIGTGECAKIMTGAAIPEGADCVIMVEYTEEDNGMIKFNAENTSNNICKRGEDIKQGDIIIKKGQKIRAAEIASLATTGYAEISVATQPKVAVIATGDELIEPSEKISGAKIRNSNSYQLCAQITACGAIANYSGIAEDTEDAIDSAIKTAMKDNHLIILSGGVSMGDFDLVPGILKKNQFEFLFESVAMQPGHPTIFGKHPTERSFCCGLPGNPVSTFVIFEIMIKPFLLAMMGSTFKPMIIPLPLGEKITRKKSVRQASLPVKIINGEAHPVEYHGSAHINAMSKADGIISIPIGVTALAKGEKVNVRLL